MSPHPSEVLRDFAGKLEKELFPNNEGRVIELKGAVSDGNFEMAANIATELGEIQRQQARFGELVTLFDASLWEISTKTGITNIPNLATLVTGQPEAQEAQAVEAPEPEPAETEPEIRAEHKKQPGPPILRILISTDSEGQPAITSLDKLLDEIIPENERGNRGARLLARQSYYNCRSLFTRHAKEALQKITESDPSATFITTKQLVSVMADRPRTSSAFRSLYAEITAKYGDMSAEQFISDIIGRDFRKKRQNSTSETPEARMPEYISSITPTDEMILCCKFLKPELIGQIERIILAGQSLSDFLQSQGNFPQNLNAGLESSRSGIYESRKRQPAKNPEINQLTRNIANLIPHLQRAGQQLVIPDRTLQEAGRLGLDVFLHLLKNTSESQRRLNELLKIMFPSYAFTIENGEVVKITVANAE